MDYFLNLFCRLLAMQTAFCQLSASLLKSLMIGYLKVTVLLSGLTYMLALISASSSCSHHVISRDLILCSLNECHTSSVDLTPSSSHSCECGPHGEVINCVELHLHQSLCGLLLTLSPCPLERRGQVCGRCMAWQVSLTLTDPLPLSENSMGS